MVYRPIEELKLDPANPRLHGKSRSGRSRNSIKTFGFNVPILTDRDDKVICGHGRLACRELGWTAGANSRPRSSDPSPGLAFMIADNRLSEIATWDDRLLALSSSRTLSLLGLDFSLEILGLVMGEIALADRCARRHARTGRRSPADDLRTVGAAAAEQIGVCGSLDRHRVLCGNALDPPPLRR
jgi:hypothetical protein